MTANEQSVGSTAYYVSGEQGASSRGRTAADEAEAVQIATNMHRDGYRKIRIHKYANNANYGFNIRSGIVVRPEWRDELEPVRPKHPIESTD